MSPLDPSNSDASIPRRLADDLAALHRHAPVPRGIDDAILQAARDGYARRRQTRLLLRWGAGAAAAAGALAACLLIVVSGPQRPSHHEAAPTIAINPPATAIAPSIATAPHPNILDALILARRIENTPAGQRPLDWDFNHDGLIDDRDPRTIAMDAVKLEGGPQ